MQAVHSCTAAGVTVVLTFLAVPNCQKSTRESEPGVTFVG